MENDASYLPTCSVELDCETWRRLIPQLDCYVNREKARDMRRQAGLQSGMRLMLWWRRQRTDVRRTVLPEYREECSRLELSRHTNLRSTVQYDNKQWRPANANSLSVVLVDCLAALQRISTCDFLLVWISRHANVVHSLTQVSHAYIRKCAICSVWYVERCCLRCLLHPIYVLKHLNDLPEIATVPSLVIFTAVTRSVWPISWCSTSPVSRLQTRSRLS